ELPGRATKLNGEGILCLDKTKLRRLLLKLSRIFFTKTSKTSIMGLLDIYNEKKHKGHLTHEIIAGAAAFEAMKHHEKKKQEQTGQKDKHAFLKEAFVAFAVAEAEKLIETKGLDAVDKAKAKKHAREQAEKLYDSNN
ncbi:11088_t:CDS:2, partial [Dentiscutata erythropus]